MEESPSWEASRFVTNQAIHRILWKPKVHDRTLKCPPPVLTVIQLDPVHFPTSPILKAHLNIKLPSKSWSLQWCLSLIFPSKACTDHSSPHKRHISRPSHSFQIYHLQNIRWAVSSSLCCFLHSPVTSFLLSIIFSSTTYSQTPSAYVPPIIPSTKFNTHTKEQAKLYFCLPWSLKFCITSWLTEDSTPEDSKHSLT